MEKSWLDTEDGREALIELSQFPNVSRVIKEAAHTYTQKLVTEVLGANVRDPNKDRSLIVAKAELDGARGVINSILQLLDEADNPRKNSPKQSRGQ